MSKYENFMNYETDLSNPLVEGETLIWSAKPKKSAFIVNKVLTMMPIALIWLLLDSSILIPILSSGEVKQMLFFIMQNGLYRFWKKAGNAVLI